MVVSSNTNFGYQKKIIPAKGTTKILKKIIFYHCVCFLGEDRGPVLEVIVSRTNFISSHTSKSVRVVGLSTALANARDLADWLGIGQVRFP